MVYLRKRAASWRWWYLSLFGWRPFAFLRHGGWVYLSLPWFKRFGVDTRRERGWRWD